VKKNRGHEILDPQHADMQSIMHNMITTPGLPGTETCDITMLKVYAQN